MADLHARASEQARDAGERLRGAGEQAETQASEAQRKARGAATGPWAAAFAHFGYAAKGIVYVLLALLVGKAALGVSGGSITDTKGALVALYSEPFGRALLGIVGVGLLGYALWNLALAALNLDHQRDDAKGIVTRIGYGALGVAYVGLAIAAFGLVAHGSGGKTSDQQAQDWTARFLALPFGVALVVLAGLVALGIAAALVYQAWSASFMRGMESAAAAMDGRMREAVEWSGRIGLSAMAVVTTIIGLFLIVAAVQHNPSEAKGLGGALTELAHAPHGPYLLAVVALGLLAFALFSLLQARYRRVG